MFGCFLWHASSMADSLLAIVVGAVVVVIVDVVLGVLPYPCWLKFHLA